MRVLWRTAARGGLRKGVQAAGRRAALRQRPRGGGGGAAPLEGLAVRLRPPEHGAARGRLLRGGRTVRPLRGPDRGIRQLRKHRLQQAPPRVRALPPSHGWLLLRAMLHRAPPPPAGDESRRPRCHPGRAARPARPEQAVERQAAQRRPQGVRRGRARVRAGGQQRGRRVVRPHRKSLSVTVCCATVTRRGPRRWCAILENRRELL
mmetsp:Transcript_31580/g.100962  ORF Transcript_31580/g.100962 Transcript_31580/m.100962 type:complete len:206 (-) Transcript_31580:20-637(-)